MSDLVSKAEQFVRAELASNDGSHDWHHIDRVRRLAMELAKEEKVEDKLTVELAALLHDIKDWKYSGSEKAGVDAAKDFLVANGCEPVMLEKVLYVIENIGFKTELGQLQAAAAPAAGDSTADGDQLKRKRELNGTAETAPTAAVTASGAESSEPAVKKQKLVITPELAVVQDADRLDAIGAMGIARCFTYGGSRNRALYDPEHPPIKDITKDQYMKQKDSPSINHFYEKLLRLKSMMKSGAGQRRAAARHTFMEQFLDQFFNEWDGKA